MSVALNAAIESYAFLWPDCRPWRQNASRMPWRDRRRPRGCCRRTARRRGPGRAASGRRASRRGCRRRPRSARRPGCRRSCSMNGGTALTSTSFATRDGAVPADVARDLAAAGGEADEDHVAQVERLDQRRQVVGVVVHVVAVPHLGRAAVAAAVVGDRAEAVVGEEELLRLPAVAAQRPAVAMHDGLAGAPVLVEDLDAVGGGDERHGVRPPPVVRGRWRAPTRARGRRSSPSPPAPGMKCGPSNSMISVIVLSAL